MESKYLFVVLVFFWNTCIAQNKVDWREDLEITFESFQGDLPEFEEDNVQQYSFSATFDLNFHMLNLQFAFTKNFNQYVSTYFIPDYSWMETGQFTEQLLLMANLDFDLLELYARKFRKRMFESKSLASNTDFYSKLYDEISKELIAKQSLIQNKIRTHDKPLEYLASEIETVNSEIKKLSEFCKTCKPQKRKKRRNK